MISDAREFWKATAGDPMTTITFAASLWQDLVGNVYALGSFEVAADWEETTRSTLRRPPWDREVASGVYLVNLAAAERARKSMVLWLPHWDTPAPLPRPDTLTVIGGMDSRLALALLGLTKVLPGAS